MARGPENWINRVLRGIDGGLRGRYDIIGRKHDVVWLDDSGVPVAFEIEQGNTLVDFHLARSLSQPEYVSADLSR